MPCIRICIPEEIFDERYVAVNEPMRNPGQELDPLTWGV
ncbi:predicted protein [Botrytis cinerea T4]|uniref:Uncharacterized protein n=1 Tax=Botryotinia fuckeliana (strain T4) TaxID=999810 RepID=G2YKK3_BOTF4|nr:predicted protein [Botrytis cinerea T4]